MTRRELRSLHYLLAYGALVLLTVLSFGLSFLRLGAFGGPVALGISVLKACVIGAVFMHLLEEPGTRSLAALGAVLLVLILVALAATDVVTRT